MLPIIILENLSDELSDEHKLSWHSSSRRIIRLWYIKKRPMMLRSMSFRLTVPNRTSDGWLDFSLQLPEIFFCRFFSTVADPYSLK